MTAACDVCGGGGIVQFRTLWSLTAALDKPSSLEFCPLCNGGGHRTPLAVLAAQEAELHDGDCCDPKAAA